MVDDRATATATGSSVSTLAGIGAVSAAVLPISASGAVTLPVVADSTTPLGDVISSTTGSLPVASAVSLRSVRSRPARRLGGSLYQSPLLLLSSGRSQLRLPARALSWALARSPSRQLHPTAARLRRYGGLGQDRSARSCRRPLVTCRSGQSARRTWAAGPRMARRYDRIHNCGICAGRDRRRFARHGRPSRR